MAERCTLLTVALLFSLVFHGHAQSDVLSAANEGAQKLAKAHAGWTRLSRAGASLEAKETLREGSVVQYHLFVHGLPADRLYQLYSWPVSVPEPTVQMEGISIGKDGLLICAGRTPAQCGDPSKKDDPIELTFSPVKAEPFRVAFISGEARVAIVLEPDPIENKHKGCNLKVVRLLPGFELAYFAGSGFAPNTKVEFDSQSYDEVHRLEEMTNADGNLQFAMLPFVSGHNREP